jgi:hypothetical protein
LDWLRNSAPIFVAMIDSSIAFSTSNYRCGADAEDASQEAVLRGDRFFGGFHGSDVRAGPPLIVRNICYTWPSDQMTNNKHIVYAEFVTSQPKSRLTICTRFEDGSAKCRPAE